jgi:hypothetical protein
MRRATTAWLSLAPGLLVSACITWLLLAALPRAAASAPLLAGVAASCALGLGVGERSAASVLLMTRRPRPDELDDLVPALTLLCRAGLGPPLVELRVRRGVAITTGGAGRRTVLVSTGLLDAIAAGDLPPDQAAALLIHAAARVRAGAHRHELLLTWLAGPWLALRAVARAGSARAHRRLPVLAAAWRLRAVVLVIAVAQAVAASHLWLACGIVVLGACSYSTPALEQRRSAALVALGDTSVVDTGLAPALAAFLRRCGPDPANRTRLRALERAQPRRSLLGPVLRP